MFSRIRSGLTYGNVVATMALFLALGGSAYAAAQLPRNSVGARQLKKNAVTSAKVKNGSLLKADFKRGELPAGAQGPKGDTGPTGRDGRDGRDGERGLKGDPGEPGRSALSALRTGETVTGTWAVTGTETGTAYTGITFPVPAPSPVDGVHVVVAGNDSSPADGCTGSSTAPVSAPGFVCIYVSNSNGTTFAGGFGGRTAAPLVSSAATDDGSVHGFLIRVSGTSNWGANGIWVYTAP
jgi:hypothetical protein